MGKQYEYGKNCISPPTFRDTNEIKVTLMNKWNNIEYCFLRYVPGAETDKGVSIAAIFIEPSDSEVGVCRMKFAADWQKKARLLDPDIDLEMVEALLREVQERLLSPGQCSEMMRELEDSFSNVIQVSERRRCPVKPMRESIEAFVCSLLAAGASRSLVPPILHNTKRSA